MEEGGASSSGGGDDEIADSPGFFGMNTDVEVKEANNPLMYSCATDHEAEARVLVAELSVDVEAKDKYGKSPHERGHDVIAKIPVVHTRSKYWSFFNLTLQYASFSAISSGICVCLTEKAELRGLLFSLFFLLSYAFFSGTKLSARNLTIPLVVSFVLYYAYIYLTTGFNFSREELAKAAEETFIHGLLLGLFFWLLLIVLLRFVWKTIVPILCLLLIMLLKIIQRLCSASIALAFLFYPCAIIRDRFFILPNILIVLPCYFAVWKSTSWLLKLTGRDKINQSVLSYIFAEPYMTIPYRLFFWLSRQVVKLLLPAVYKFIILSVFSVLWDEPTNRDLEENIAFVLLQIFVWFIRLYYWPDHTTTDKYKNS